MTAVTLVGVLTHHPQLHLADGQQACRMQVAVEEIHFNPSMILLDVTSTGDEAQTDNQLYRQGHNVHLSGRLTFQHANVNEDPFRPTDQRPRRFRWWRLRLTRPVAGDTRINGATIT